MYALLNKALHGTVQASLLFWMRLSTFFVEKHGFKHNPYDYCVVNNVIDKNQCMIVNLKVSHVDDNMVSEILEPIKDEFAKDLDVAMTCGKLHDYLGMQIDFSKKGKVALSMFDYIDGLLKECPEDLMKGVSSSGACTM
jgi:Reverse transcriptase (RNA-dependent DNA polymerase)